VNSRNDFGHNDSTINIVVVIIIIIVIRSRRCASNKTRPIVTIVAWSLRWSQAWAALERLNRSSCRLGCGVVPKKKEVGPGSPTGRGTFGGHVWACLDLLVVDNLNFVCRKQQRHCLWLLLPRLCRRAECRDKHICLSISDRTYISGLARPNFTRFSVHAIYCYLLPWLDPPLETVYIPPVSCLNISLMARNWRHEKVVLYTESRRHSIGGSADLTREYTQTDSPGGSTRPGRSMMSTVALFTVCQLSV